MCDRTCVYVPVHATNQAPENREIRLWVAGDTTPPCAHWGRIVVTLGQRKVLHTPTSCQWGVTTKRQARTRVARAEPGA
jgi:hypothetical protein